MRGDRRPTGLPASPAADLDRPPGPQVVEVDPVGLGFLPTAREEVGAVADERGGGLGVVRARRPAALDRPRDPRRRHPRDRRHLPAAPLVDPAREAQFSDLRLR